MKFKTNIGLALIFGAIIAISLAACPPEETPKSKIDLVPFSAVKVSTGGANNLAIKEDGGLPIYSLQF